MVLDRRCYVGIMNLLTKFKKIFDITDHVKTNYQVTEMEEALNIYMGILLRPTLFGRCSSTDHINPAVKFTNNFQSIYQQLSFF